MRWLMLDIFCQDSHKNIPHNLFFFWNELIGNALLIDSVMSYVLYRSTAHSFVESQAACKLLNAYNEPGIKSLILFPPQLHRYL